MDTSVVVVDQGNIVYHMLEMSSNLYLYHILNNPDHVHEYHLMALLNVNNDNIQVVVVVVDVNQYRYEKVNELNPYDVIQWVHQVGVLMLHENVSEWLLLMLIHNHLKFKCIYYLFFMMFIILPRKSCRL
jgi:hypothetical protein